MHRALYVAEIARLVCDNANQSSLVALARCCSALHQEAMTALWRKLDTLAPLVSTLPSDCWVIEKREQRLTRPLIPSDWTTFLKLAAHVRNLAPPYRRLLRYSDTSVADAVLRADVISTLCKQRPQTTIFPNLRSLDQEALARSFEQIADFLLMVGPQLTRLRMGRFKSPGQLYRALIIVYTRFLQLRDFSVGVALFSDLQDMPTSLSISPAWITASPLVRFHCDQLALTEETIGALSTLATLEELSVRLPAKDSFPHINTAASPFSKVRVLDIVATTDVYVAFANAVGVFPCVREFMLRIEYDEPNTIPPHQLVDTITASLVPELVTQISVSARDMDDALDTAALPIEILVFFRAAAFRPLLKFARMYQFTFTLPWVHDVDDALFLDVAKAWPELSTFYLGTEPYCMWMPPSNCPTLRSLPPFAVYCPSLSELGFQFNAMDVEVGRITPNSELYGELRDSSSCSRSVLYWLQVATSPIAYPAQVAGFISCVFPELMELKYSSFMDFGEVGAKFEERWDEVSRVLPVLKLVRENERKRVQFDEVDGWPGDDTESAVSVEDTP
ncbi:hypothetical protein VTO73DRAFT_5615 [Trametes versicolor]